jgi:hypothetical protein
VNASGEAGGLHESAGFYIRMQLPSGSVKWYNYPCEKDFPKIKIPQSAA